MPRHARQPTKRKKPKRLLDRALGCSRRRRRVAYVAIVGGLRMLRPALQRAAVATAAVGAAATYLIVS